MRLYGRRSAFNVQKVLWALGELRLDYEHRELGGSFGGLDDAEFLAMNPHGRVPVWVDDSATVWESHAILRYLAATYGSGSLWSTSPVERSLADRWMDWSQSTLQPDFMRLFWGYYRTPPEQRKQHAIDAALDACARHFDLLDAHLAKQPFLGGESFSLADIPAGTSLHRYFEMGLELPRPTHVCAWHDRLSTRPAYVGSVSVPFDELRGRVDF